MCAHTHPHTRAPVCVRASVRELVHGDRRVKYPMKKVGGQWQRIGWDQALTEITDKIEEAVQAGPSLRRVEEENGDRVNAHLVPPGNEVHEQPEQHAVLVATRAEAGRDEVALVWAPALRLLLDGLEQAPRLGVAMSIRSSRAPPPDLW